MKRTWTSLHIVALVVGGYIVATEIGSNVEHIIHGTGSFYNPAVFTAIGVSIGTVFAFTMAMDALEDWKKLSSWVNATGLAAAFLFGTAFTLTTTLDRTATARDSLLSKKWKEDDEMANLAKMYQNISLQSTQECGSGRGKKCDALSAERSSIEQRILAKQEDLDSMGKRIHKLTGGMISVSAASIFQPMFMPIAMFLMGTFMVAYGVKGKFVKPEFDIQTLTGMDSKEDKAKRYIEKYRAAKGSAPTIMQVKTVAEVSYPTAKKYLARYS
jgi:hypothetical protein